MIIKSSHHDPGLMMQSTACRVDLIDPGHQTSTFHTLSTLHWLGLLCHRLSKAAMQEGRRREVVADPRTRRLVDRTAMLVHTLNTIELANVINGLSKLSYPVDPAFMQLYTEAAHAYLDDFNPQEVANIINGFAGLQYDPGPAFVEHLVRAADRQLDTFNTQELAVLLNGIARVGHLPDPAFLGRFAECFQRQMRHATSQNLANVANAFGKMDYSPPAAFWADFVAAARPILSDFKPQELSNAIHALGKLNVTLGEGMVAELQSQAFVCMLAFKPQELCISVGGLLRMGMGANTTFLSRVAEASYRCMARTNDQDIVLLVQALGRYKFDPGREWLSALMARVSAITPILKASGLGHVLRFLASNGLRPSPAFMKSVRERVEATVQDCAVSDIVRLAGSFATLEYVPGPKFLEAVRGITERDMRELKGNEVSALLHFICRDVADPVDFWQQREMAIVRWAVNRTWEGIEDFQPVHLASLLTSVSRVGWRPPVPFLDVCRDRVLCSMAEFENQEVVNVLSAFARTNYHPGDTWLRGAIRNLCESMAQMTIQGLSNTMNALAKFGFDPGEPFWPLVEVLLTRFGTRLGLSLPEMSYMLWALAVLDSPSSGSLTRWLVVEVLRVYVEEAPKKETVYVTDVYSQLKQTLLYAELLRPDLLPPALLLRFRVVVEHVGARTRSQADGPRTSLTVSSLQRDVASVMASLGARFEEEVDDGVFYFDMLLHCRRPSGLAGKDALPLVVEVDGPPHYFANLPQVALQDTEFKRSIVRAQTDKYRGLVPVPYYHWRRGGNKAELLSQVFREEGFDLQDYLPEGALARFVSHPLSPSSQRGGKGGDPGAVDPWDQQDVWQGTRRGEAKGGEREREGGRKVVKGKAEVVEGEGQGRRSKGRPRKEEGPQEDKPAGQEGREGQETEGGKKRGRRAKTSEEVTQAKRPRGRPRKSPSPPDEL